MVSESDFIAAFQAYHDALEDPAAKIDTIRPLVNDHLEQLIARLPGTVVQNAARDRAMVELDRIEGMAKEQSVELAAEAQRLEGEVRAKATRATLFVEPAEPEEGSPFTVGFSGSSGSEHAWIGIFPEGSPNTEHGANWLYVGGSQHPGEAKTAGSLEFGGEQYVAGDYEARLFRNSAHDMMASTSFSISTESEEFEDEIRARTMGHEEDAEEPEFEVVGEEPSDKMRDAFNLFDRDGNGVIDIGELGLMMNALGENMSPDEVGNMLAEADADGDGVINFEEFKVIMSMDRSGSKTPPPLPSGLEDVDEEDVPEEPEPGPEISSTSGSITDVIAHLDTLKLFGAKRRYIESLSSEVFDFNLTIESMDKTIGIGLSDEFRGGHTCIGTVDGIGVGVRMPNTMELEIGQEIYVEAKLLEYRSVVKRFEFEQL